MKILDLAKIFLKGSNSAASDVKVLYGSDNFKDNFSFLVAKGVTVAGKRFCGNWIISKLPHLLTDLSYIV